MGSFGVVESPPLLNVARTFVCVDRSRLLALRGCGSFHQRRGSIFRLGWDPCWKFRIGLSWRPLVASGEKIEKSVNEEGNGTVPRMCPKCVYSSPFQSHTRGIGVRMWLI
jgi:hypothetical protein